MDTIRKKVRLKFAEDLIKEALALSDNLVHQREYPNQFHVIV